ncbi:unnamed protein product [Ostreobium quekettii]|uniref:Uncharacterized protein n=1 Tax=Ostreobium quekettii TaxID=121088 RepID=A0A8S1IZZ1_9CHLO|nr:unnamed protein product [Ostreobium quekettii]
MHWRWCEGADGSWAGWPLGKRFWWRRSGNEPEATQIQRCPLTARPSIQSIYHDDVTSAPPAVIREIRRSCPLMADVRPTRGASCGLGEVWGTMCITTDCRELSAAAVNLQHKDMDQSVM